MERAEEHKRKSKTENNSISELCKSLSLDQTDLDASPGLDAVWKPQLLQGTS